MKAVGARCQVAVVKFAVFRGALRGVIRDRNRPSAVTLRKHASRKHRDQWLGGGVAVNFPEIGTVPISKVVLILMSTRLGTNFMISNMLLISFLCVICYILSEDLFQIQSRRGS